jgi:hypothetical protein
MIDHLETNNLFQLIESWKEENIDLALILVKNNNELKQALISRYAPILDLVGSKNLSALKKIPKNISEKKFYKKK